ncbi:MAG: hypothetical protein AAFZ05_10935 [Pseudomonadota bacterium]
MATIDAGSDKRSTDFLEVENTRGYVDWAAIIAGALFTGALSYLLLTFGAGLGLSLASFERGEGTGLAWLAIAATIWTVWSQVTSYAGGAYLAGRLRARRSGAEDYEVEIRDGTHGLMVWAISFLIGLYMTAMMAGSAANTTARVAGAATQAIGTAVSTTAQGVGSAVSSAGTAAANNADQIQQAALRAADALYRPDVENDITEQVRERLRSSVPTITEQERRELVDIFQSLRDGELSEQERRYLTAKIEAKTGIAPEQAQARLNAAVTQVQQAATTAADQAREAANRAKNYAVLLAFLTAATALVCAAVAWFAAKLGGQHRDDGTNTLDLIKRKRGFGG